MKAMLKKVISSALLVAAISVGVVGTLLPTAAHAADCTAITTGIAGGADCAKPSGVATNLFGTSSVFVTITNILLFIIGAIAVIMLIIGGVRYVVSAGDQSAVTSAKNTILYAIIGIIVAFLAYAAVNFVSSQLQTGTNGAQTTYKAVNSRIA